MISMGENRYAVTCFIHPATPWSIEHILDHSPCHSVGNISLAIISNIAVVHSTWGDITALPDAEYTLQCTGFHGNSEIMTNTSSLTMQCNLLYV